MEIRAFRVTLLASALAFAVAALLLAGPLAGAAWAQEEDGPLIDQTGGGEGELINQGDDGEDEGADDDQYNNTAAITCTQILQQIGGDQYANATGAAAGDDDGDDVTDDTTDDVAEENQEEAGDTAAVNNQEFSAEQIQKCLALAGNDNNVNDGGNANGTDDGDDNGDDGNGDDADDSDTDEDLAVQEKQGDVIDEVKVDRLVDTGGMSLYTLAAFAGGAVLLVVGGVALLVYGLRHRRPGRL
jgi:hypothetical protein